MACARPMQKFLIGSSNQVPTSMGQGLQRGGGGSAFTGKRPLWVLTQIS